MSTPTSNTAVTSTTSSGLSIGLIFGIIVALVAIIAVVIFVIKRRRNAGGSAAAVPTAANGMGAMNNGSNAVPRTNMNVNSGNGRPPQ
jgi:uncharacterized protein (UPF0333 family)